MRETLSENRNPITFLTIIALIVAFFIYNVSEKGDPMGIRIDETKEIESLQPELQLLYDAIPEEWRNVPGTRTHYNIKIEREFDSHRCNIYYFHTQSGQFKTTVTVTDVTNSEIVAQQEFLGQKLKACPQTESQVVGFATAPEVSPVVIQQWLIDTMSGMPSLVPLNNITSTERDGIFYFRGSPSYISDLPPEWFVTPLEKPRYRLSVDGIALIVETCEYGGPFGTGPTIFKVDRIRHNEAIVILDLQSNELIANEIIAGSMPEDCPARRGIDPSDVTIEGSSPEEDLVQQTLKELLEGLPNLVSGGVSGD